MNFPSPSSSPSCSPSSTSTSKRPRLSLQIKTPITPQTLGKSATALKADVDPTSPTAFNTLSNAYAVAIENSSPITPKVSASEPRNVKSTPLRLQTSMSFGDHYVHPSQRTQTPGPFSISYPESPATAHPETQKTETPFTYTPPQSAGLSGPSRVFTFTAQTPEKASASPRTPRRRATFTGNFQVAPYTHPRSLRSILRNSPLPPPSTVTPVTPRTSLRLANRATKKVGYNDPLTQTIITNKYTTSHIELLAEDEKHEAMADAAEGVELVLDVTMAYNREDDTRDGGQTPGPFEEMRRRMAGLGSESDPETPGLRKRKRKDKKRKWVWTIGDESDDSDPIEGTPMTAVRDDTPATAIWRGSSVASDSTMESIDERPGTAQSL
ncbi:hypothetical protein BP5796_06394 [Coleophoma crateriformis]|uniref:Glucan 4-alpha-glucosidase-like protein n=1 Tax=Coleophoma crateriformis TaxID=565419 RepID=A0A3D8RNE9_9HELO|nr:hypothetical protein BP5796_06394 [Coleophoma crateriformis]